MTVSQSGAVVPPQEPGDPSAGNPNNDPYAELRDPSNGKLFGKYDTLQQAKDGYWSSQRVLGETSARERALAEMVVQGQQQDRMSPAQRADSRRDPAEELQAMGVPFDPLRTVIRNEAQELVRAQLEPFFKLTAGRTRMMTEDPTFPQREGRVMGFVNANPMLAETFNAIAASEPYAALRYADTLFQSSAARGARQQDAETEAAKVAAGMPGGSGGPSRSAVSQGMLTKETLENSLAEAMRTRDPQSQADFFGHWLNNRPLLWGEKGATQE